MDDPVEGGQIRSIIERVQRLQEEKRTIEDDIKEVYAEARANGFDVKVLRAVVKHLGKDQAEVSEFEAIFDLYLQAFEQGASASRAHMARDADARTREAASNLYPGRIARPGETARRAHSEMGDAVGTAPIARTPESEHVDRSASAQPHSAAGRPAISSKAGDAGTGQADYATTRGQSPSEGEVGSAVRAGAPISEIAAPDLSTAAQSEGAAGASPEQEASGSADRDGDTSVAAQDAEFAMSTGAGEGIAHSADPAPAADETRFALPAAKPMRPNCLKPEACAGMGSNHCFTCTQAANAARQPAYEEA